MYKHKTSWKNYYCFCEQDIVWCCIDILENLFVYLVKQL